MENEENQEQVFLRFPPPLGIAARFPHSHSRGNDREGKWKSKNRIPTFPSRLVVSLQILERRILLNAGSAVLQAHPSIRKCYNRVTVTIYLATLICWASVNPMVRKRPL